MPWSQGISPKHTAKRYTIVMAISIKGHTALITGASRGIGEAVAYRLADEGCNLLLTARNLERLEQVAGRCRLSGVNATCVTADMAKPHSLDVMVDACIEEYGGLDILVNNAGVFNRGPLEEMSQAELDEMLVVNLGSVIHLTRLAIPHVIAGAKAGGRGAVIFIASRAGRMSFPGSSGYCATKHGVVGFSGSVFQDLRAHGIKVCAINPSYTATEMVESYNFSEPTMIQPEEVAELVRTVATWPTSSCPVEILLETQVLPELRGES